MEDVGPKGFSGSRDDNIREGPCKGGGGGGGWGLRVIGV